ncbi:hypothetical protein TrVE_jg10068 [Triparma verrucosa]|uniref:Uncharacterized protein n=1 Tax=Triparma verrucosa TaxID=1606542 RepID=A0A9W7FAF2_9STRA|nr:hypothetical protein TrVE_jg10068 [Triparma verrucosa]
MSELRSLTHGQYDDDGVHNSVQRHVEQNEDPKTNREPTSNLLQESTQQQATSPITPSLSPPSVSADPQVGRDHPTALHCTHHASLQDEGEIGGQTVHLLRMELEKEKEFKANAESEMAAALCEKDAALKREKAALSEKDAALRREEAALREKEAALREKEAALRETEAALKEKAALEEEPKNFSAVMSQLGEEGDTLRKKLRHPDRTAQLEYLTETTEQFCLDMKGSGDADAERCQESNKVAPMMSQTSTALSIFSSPEATQYIENLNKDLDFENEKVLQMDNVIQRYTEEEDAMITSGLGLIAGMEMKGAIAFSTFKTRFSATKFLKGFYNSKEALKTRTATQS